MALVFGYAAVALFALYGLSLLLKSIGIQLPGIRSLIKWRATKRFKTGVVVFAGALFVLGYFFSWLIPYLVAGVHMVVGGAQQAASGTASAGRATGSWLVQALPWVVGIGLGLWYWVAASKWIDKGRDKHDRWLRQVGAGIPFFGLFVLYLWLFIA